MDYNPSDLSALRDLFPHHSKPQLLATLQQQGTLEAAVDALLTTPPECQTSSGNGLSDGAAPTPARAHTPPVGAARRAGHKGSPAQQQQQPRVYQQHHTTPHHQQQQQQERVSWGRLESAVKPPSLTPSKQQQRQPPAPSPEAFPSLTGGPQSNTSTSASASSRQQTGRYSGTSRQHNSSSRWATAAAATSQGLARRRSLSAGDLTTTTGSSTSSSSQPRTGQPQSTTTTGAGQRSAPHARSAPPSPARAARVAAGAQPAAGHQKQPQQQLLLQVAARQQEADLSGIPPQQQGRDALLMGLWEQHPWADFDLLLAVAHSVDFDPAEAAAALQDMQHSTQHAGTGRSGRAGGAAASTAAAGVDGVNAAHTAAGRLQGLALSAKPGQEAQTTAVRAAAIAAPGASPSTSDSEWSDEEGHQVHHHLQQQQQQLQHQHPQQQQQQPGSQAHQLAPAGAEEPSSSSSGQQEGPGQTSSSTVNTVEEDLYRVHRRPALKLTHAWRKAVRRSAAAFGAGDHSAGHALATEARSLRSKALAAHAAAAQLIQAAVNAGNGPWELDLHGLHVGEAVAALAQRLAGLEGTAPLMLPAAAGGAAAGVTAGAGEGQEGVSGSWGVGAAHVAASSSSRGISPYVMPGGVAGGLGPGQQVKPPGVSGVTCAPPFVDAVTSTPAGSVRQVQPGVPLPPGKQAPVLTVIVGRGLHSSEGEASVPRAVEGWLMEHKYRYRSGLGVLYVHVRRTGMRAA